MWQRAWTRTKAHLSARPWSVKLYVTSTVASTSLLLAPDVSLNSSGSLVLHLLLVLGVWMGRRLAWGLSVATSAAALIFFLAVGTDRALRLPAVLAVWVGLLLAAQTREWVGARRGLVTTTPEAS